MEYSVGSLSDLITGKTTPNKRKVVVKKFTPKITEISDENVSFEKSSKNRKSSLVPEEVFDSTPTPSKKLKKNKKSLSNDEMVIDLNPTPSKKLKSLNVSDEIQTDQVESPKKKKSKKSKSLNNTVKSELNSTTELTETKGKKRKVDDILDDDAGDIEEITPKKSKSDINAERRIKKKLKEQQKIEPSEEELARTVFVGNLPITTKKNKLKRFFMKYGAVDTVRIRGVAPADPKVPKKIAIIKNELHPQRKSFYGYVKFENEEDAAKATEANGLVFHEHHLRVHLCSNKDKPDETKAIFVGNLAFDAEEEELWKHFEPCGAISSVRIIRDARTGMGKGIGYVNFHKSDSVQLALEMNNMKLKDREVRISLCNINAAKKNRKLNRAKKISKPGKPRVRKEKTNKESKDGGDESKPAPPVNQIFQGKKIDSSKKKNKLNKGLQQKKKMMKKIAPKSNKSL